MGNCSSSGAKLSFQKFFRASILDPNVSFDSSTDAKEISIGSLEITKFELVLHQKGMQSTRWPYCTILRCQYKGSLFIFETKNKSLIENLQRHVFLVKHANVLFQQIQNQIAETNAAQSVHSGSKHSLLTSDSDDKYFKRLKQNHAIDGVIYPSRMSVIGQTDVTFDPLSGDEGFYGSIKPSHSSYPSSADFCSSNFLQRHLSLRHKNHYYPPPQPHFHPPTQHPVYQHLQNFASSLAVPQQLKQFQNQSNCSQFRQKHSIRSFDTSSIFDLSTHHDLYSEIPSVYLYPTDEVQHHARHSFSKSLKNNDLKRKYITEEIDLDEDIKKEKKQCKKKHFNKHNLENDLNFPNVTKHLSDLSASSFSPVKPQHRSLDMLDLDLGKNPFKHTKEGSINAIYYL